MGRISEKLEEQNSRWVLSSFPFSKKYLMLAMRKLGQISESNLLPSQPSAAKIVWPLFLVPIFSFLGVLACFLGMFKLMEW